MSKSMLLAASCIVSLAGWATACGGGGSGASDDGDGAVQDGANSPDTSGIGKAPPPPPPGDSSISQEGGRDADGGTAPDTSVPGDGAPSSDAPAGDSAGQPDATAVATAVQMIISSYCTALQTCCQQAEIGDAGAIANCATELPMDLQELGMAKEGSLVISPTGLQAWIAAYQQAAKDCLTPPFSVLDNLWVGTSATGQSCVSAENCATDPASDPVVCVVGANMTDGAPATGVCHPVTHAASGAACTSSCTTGEDCSYTLYDDSPNPIAAECYTSDGLICSPQTSSCVKLTPIGSECSSDSDCGDLNYCDTSIAAPKCKAQVGEGSPCPNDNACFEQFECGTAGTCVGVPFADDYRCGGGLP